MPEAFNLDAALSDEATPKGLREWAEKQKKQNDELADKLAKIEAEQRSTTIVKALKDKGVNEKVASFYPSTEPATPEAIEKWVGQYADVFGGPPAVQDVPPAPGAPVDHNPLAADVRAAMTAVQNATPQQGANTQTLADRVAALDKLDMRSAATGQELENFQQELMGMAKQYVQQYNS